LRQPINRGLTNWLNIIELKIKMLTCKVIYHFLFIFILFYFILFFCFIFVLFYFCFIFVFLAYNQFQKWEERMSQLLEERKKFVSYLGSFFLIFYFFILFFYFIYFIEFFYFIFYLFLICRFAWRHDHGKSIMPWFFSFHFYFIIFLLNIFILFFLFYLFRISFTVYEMMRAL